MLIMGKAVLAFGIFSVLAVLATLVALTAAAGLAPSARRRLHTLDLSTIRRRVLPRGR